ncbi:MAG TPA: hypothetical protein VGV57_04435 [Thermoleophilaceae bacterium]|nr:hypothetical protein [Thermoleophilaceae bacterium]
MTGAPSSRPADRYRRGLLTSIRNNAAAYGYSVMITSSYGVLSTGLGSPSVGRTLLFGLGATVAFVVVETLSARGLRHRERGERSDVVALGSALNVLSVGSGVGLAALAPLVLAPQLAWPAGSFLATLVYLLLGGAELTAAERFEADLTGEDPAREP